MARVREFRASDLPRVVDLHQEVARSSGRAPASDLHGFFERALLDHPWADPSVPSFVHEAADGEITAFVASFPVRQRVGRRLALTVVSGCHVASPRAPGSGGLVLRRQLNGRQELSLAHDGTDATRSLWSALGGQPLLHGAIRWRHTLRAAVDPTPPTTGTSGAPRAGTAVAGVLGTTRRRIAFDIVETTRGSATRDELLTPEVLLDAVRDLPFLMRTDYDDAYLRWLFARLEESTPVHGPVVRHLVTSCGGGRPEGWYVYRLAPSGAADVLALVGCRGRTGRVLDHLLADAANRGAHEVRGRLEPGCADVLTRPEVELRRAAWSMVRTHDPLLLAHFGSPTTAVTLLDGHALTSHDGDVG